MNRYLRVAMLLAALAAGAVAAHAQSSSTKVSVSTLNSSNGKATPTNRTQLPSSQDSIMQALNDAALQIQQAALELAKQAEEQSAAIVKQLQQEALHDAEHFAQNNRSITTTRSGSNERTVINSDNRTVIIDNDSVWIERAEIKNGKIIKKKSVYPTHGKQVTIQGDSVYFNEIGENRSPAVKVYRYDGDSALVINNLLDEATAEELRTLTKQFAKGAGSVMNCLYHMMTDRMGPYMSSEEVAQIKKDLREAYETVQLEIQNFTNPKREGVQ